MSLNQDTSCTDPLAVACDRQDRPRGLSGTVRVCGFGECFMRAADDFRRRAIQFAHKAAQPPDDEEETLNEKSFIIVQFLLGSI